MSDDATKVTPGRAAVRHPGCIPARCAGRWNGGPGRSRGRDRRTGGAQKRPARLTAGQRGGQIHRHSPGL